MSTRYIYLLRHAKSSWDDPGMEDFQRPLNKRGRHAARQMAEHFRHAGIRPEVVLCSTAVRTRQTLDLLKPALGEVPQSYDGRIYEASRQTLLARLAELPAGTASVLVVGHNPGLERLALFLTDDHDDSANLAALREKFPTGALAVLASDVDHWNDLAAATCRLEGFVRPADLEKGDAL